MLLHRGYVRWLALALLLVLPGVAQAQITFTAQRTPDSDPAAVTYWSDFTENIGGAGFAYYNNNGGSYIASEASRPGLQQLIPNATTVVSSIYFLYANSAVYNSITYLRLDARFYSGANQATYRVGLTDNGTSNPPSTGAYFEKLNSDTNWFAVTRVGGAETRTDTGVAWAANTFVTFEIRPVAAGPRFYIGGVLVATNTTNLPTTQVLGPTLFDITTGTVVNLDVDYYQMRVTTSRIPVT